MTLSKFVAFAGSIAALSTLSFAWSISGNVLTNQGQPIPGVQITTPDAPSINATTTDAGAFTITNEGSGLRTFWAAKGIITFNHNVISISNIKAQTITVSVMDALGKVCASKTEHNVTDNMTIDLNKTSAKGAKFIRINADGNRNTYKLGKVVSLLKEGDALPTFLFKKAGFKDRTYTMTRDVETSIFIIMEAGETPASSVTDPTSSAATPTSSVNPASSSTVVPPASSTATVSSSSKAQEIDCSTKTLKTNTEITVDGRKVIVRFPNNFTGDKPVPMLINYHQIYGSASGWENESKIGKVALADGAISIYPDGVEGQMGQAWNVGPCCTTADDVQFTRNFVKELTEKACVDPKRIYAAGWSMGGGMSNYAGCVLADIIAAAAPSAFDLTREIVDAGKCNPARPFPVLNFRSTNDAVVGYEGGLSQIVPGMPITFMGAKATFAEWAKLDGCTGSPVNKDGCEMYENCQGGAKVGLCSLNTDHSEGDPNVAWNFLKQFSLP